MHQIRQPQIPSEEAQAGKVARILSLLDNEKSDSESAQVEESIS
jgi:hypothetical protein